MSLTRDMNIPGIRSSRPKVNIADCRLVLLE